MKNKIRRLKERIKELRSQKISLILRICKEKLRQIYYRKEVYVYANHPMYDAYAEIIIVFYLGMFRVKHADFRIPLDKNELVCRKHLAAIAAKTDSIHIRYRYTPKGWKEELEVENSVSH